jgi:hypothetical protein
MADAVEASITELHKHMLAEKVAALQQVRPPRSTTEHRENFA